MQLLLVAVVHQQDSERLVKALREAGLGSTQLGSVGGFLGSGNVTLLVGIEEEQEAATIAIFERECAAREVDVPLVLAGRLEDWMPRVVQHGRATIFVVELRRTVRV